MGPSPTCHPPEGEECETLVEHGLPLWAELAVGYCSRRTRPSPMWGSRFVGARAVGPWVGEQKLLGKSPLRVNPSPESTYLPTCTGGGASTRLGGMRPPNLCVMQPPHGSSRMRPRGERQPNIRSGGLRWWSLSRMPPPPKGKAPTPSPRPSKVAKVAAQPRP